MPILEVIACSVADAIEAERGGAGRLEIVRALDAGGLTPPVSLVREILTAVSIPVRVMLRENAGFESGGEAEIEGLCRVAREFAALGVDGLVLGFVRGRKLDLAPVLQILSSCVRCESHVPSRIRRIGGCRGRCCCAENSADIRSHSGESRRESTGCSNSSRAPRRS